MANHMALHGHFSLHLHGILVQCHKQAYFVVLFQLIRLKHKNSKNIFMTLQLWYSVVDQMRREEAFLLILSSVMVLTGVVE